MRPRVSGPSSPCTSPTAQSFTRANCSSPSIRGRSLLLSPKRVPPSPARAATCALAQADYRPGRPAARSRCGVSKRRRPAARAGPGDAQAALAAANARVQARALDVELHPGPRTDQRPHLGPPDRCGQSRPGRRQRRRRQLLTTINALDPIYFTFDASEALFLKARRARETGARHPAVEIRLQDETDYRWHGRLDFTDNGLDSVPERSGCARSSTTRASSWTPGMFGNMRLSDRRQAPALLVPDSAVQTDQARKIVLVVGKDGNVAPRPVWLGPSSMACASSVPA